MDESFKSPLVKALGDRFVWIKVDSDKNIDIKEFYEQKGYPLIVLMNPEGEVVKKIDGFRNGAILSQELGTLVKYMAKVDLEKKTL